MPQTMPPKKTDTARRMLPAVEAPAPEFVPLSLEERANLARNLYALNDWLKEYLKP